MITPSPLPQVIPDLNAAIDLKLKILLQTLNCHKVGEVQSFNSQLQTATVKIMHQINVAGILAEYPLLVDVPVFILGGGDRVVTLPVRQGDTCLVLFHDRDFDKWYATGASVEPNTARLHDLADGLCLVGFRSMANPVTAYSTTDVEVRNGSNRLAVGDQFLMKNSSTDLKFVLDRIIDCLNVLNSVKIGGNATAHIAVATTQINLLLKSS